MGRFPSNQESSGRRTWLCDHLPKFHGNARGSNPMSHGTITPARRVRHEVRDSLAVMAFSALSSIGVAVLLTVLVRN